MSGLQVTREKAKIKTSLSGRSQKSRNSWVANNKAAFDQYLELRTTEHGGLFLADNHLLSQEIIRGMMKLYSTQPSRWDSQQQKTDVDPLTPKGS